MYFMEYVPLIHDETAVAIMVIYFPTVHSSSGANGRNNKVKDGVLTTGNFCKFLCQHGLGIM